MLPDVTDFCRLYLLRHPELDAAHSSLAVGDGEATLSRRGQATAIDWMKLFETIELDAVVAANQPQSADPAAAIAAAKGLEVQSEPRLRDQHLGSWQGRSWEELAAEDPDRVRDFFGEFGEVPAPDGESLGAAVERFFEWWIETKPQSLGKTIAVVTSGAMVTGFTAAMLGMRLSRAVSLNLPHGGLGIVDVFDNGARIATWNPTALSAD